MIIKMGDFMKKIFTKILLFCLLLVPSIAATREVNDNTDPLSRLNYTNAFNPKRFKNFKKLMEHWGCASNALVAEAEDVASIETELSDESVYTIGLAEQTQDHVPLLDEEKAAITDTNWAQQEKKFRNACALQLKWARRASILHPAREAGTSCITLGAGAGLTYLALGPNSFGGSFFLGVCLMESMRYVRDCMRACLDLHFTPPSPLDSLEKRYALEQCFIPRALWPMIRDKFTMARTNQFEQQQCIDFIEFALGLTQFKPQKPPVYADLADVQGQIAEKIDKFFADYERFDDLTKLKTQIAKFIDKLIKKDSPEPRPLYLVGTPGLGKSRFVEELNTWLNEAITGSVNFEKVVVDSPAKLAGDETHHGVFLDALRNQLQAHKHGIVLFLDEATWLTHDQNDPWTSCANLVFNGTLAMVSTKYFGTGSLGTGFSLDMPPMLVFTASNSEIKAESLISRFEIIHFPEPKKEALVAYAIQCFEKSAQYAQVQTQNQAEEIISAIHEKLMPSPVARTTMTSEHAINSFRDIESFTDMFVYKELHKHARTFLTQEL